MWTTYYSSGDPVFVITSRPARDYYFLYEYIASGNLKKLGKAKSPTELEEKYKIRDRIS